MEETEFLALEPRLRDWAARQGMQTEYIPDLDDDFSLVFKPYPQGQFPTELWFTANYYDEYCSASARRTFRGAASTSMYVPLSTTTVVHEVIAALETVLTWARDQQDPDYGVSDLETLLIRQMSPGRELSVRKKAVELAETVECTPALLQALWEMARSHEPKDPTVSAIQVLQHFGYTRIDLRESIRSGLVSLSQTSLPQAKAALKYSQLIDMPHHLETLYPDLAPHKFITV